MPPNKPKLYKSKPTKQNTPQPSTSQTTPNTQIPNQEQFEVELYWCIQQLQTSLSSGKLNNKQVQDSTKSLNVLMSSTAPIVKKRQIMRLCFGDYREKMATEEKKLSKNAANIKIQSGTTNKKTVFLKKSIFSSSVDNNFKFNFDLQDDNSKENITSNVESKSDSKTLNSIDSFQFLPSNNTFRFDFKVEGENEM